MTDRIGILDPSGENLNPITLLPYTDEYKRLAKFWSDFPAYKEAKNIIKDISDNQLLFVISGTGSGKTVLIPKFALHHTDYVGRVAVTLPKRVVTHSAADFAAKTLDVKLGEDIGYIYKGAPRDASNENNKIVYMTDGSLIMKFVNDPLLNEYKVIIIDEAHERKIQIDLIMLFLKKLLESGKRPDLKVIIMSATIDGEKYKKYFPGIKSKIINISGKPNYPINVIFSKQHVKNYLREGYEIINDLITPKERRDILFFLTSSNEAFQMCRKIKLDHPKTYCIEVYGDMPKQFKIYAESRDEFTKLGDYREKLIMATNVAESSLTIDGLNYVVDSCHELYSYFDPEHAANVLEKRLITKAQAIQRQGRVGRTQPGTCYHLVTQEEFNSLEQFPTPDILRQDITLELVKIILVTNEKTLDAGVNQLSELMDPPKKKYIDYSINLLQFYNIISDGVLTKLGNDISSFSSLSLNRALFLLYSYQLYCAKEASIIIAMMETLGGKFTNIFLKDEKKNKSYDKMIDKYARELSDKSGDHISFYKLYELYTDAVDKPKFLAKYNLRGDTFNTVKKLADQYYYKVIRVSRAAPMDRVKDINLEKKITEALRLSHRHMTASRMKTIYPEKSTSASIQSDSVVNYYYKQSSMKTKTFIYDELSSINGAWEFSGITILSS